MEIYFDASAELTVNNPREAVQMEAVSGAVPAGSVEQAVLGKKGDDLRIDWGYLYLAKGGESTAATAFGQRDAMQAAFAAGGSPGDAVPAATTGESGGT